MEEVLKLVRQGNFDKFQGHILERYANQEWMLITNKSKDTVSHVAARFGHVEFLKYFQDVGVNFELSNFDGKRPLHEASQSGHAGCVQFLLSAGVKVDSLKRADWTPLMLACCKDDLDIVRDLISYGADPSLCNKDGWNSLHLACRQGNMSIVQCLLHHDSLLAHSVSKNGRTVLHTAALHGKLDVVKVLVNQCGCRLDAQDSCGGSSLMDALRSGHVTVARFLIGQGASLHQTDTRGRHCVHVVSEAGSIDSLCLLVEEYHANIDEQTSAGLTPLHLAAKEGQTAMVERLLTLGADVTLTDQHGRSALDVALANGHANCVRLLSRTDHRGRVATDDDR